MAKLSNQLLICAIGGDCKAATPDTEVLCRANMSSVYTILQKAQARWAGHVLGMEDKRIPKFLLYEELVEGRRQAGRPKLRFKDNLKTTLKSLEVSNETWKTLASDQPIWRTN